MSLFSSLFAKILLCFVVWGAPAKVPDPVQVAFISDRAGIEKEANFSIGVAFEIEPGWHIYAKEPGEGGAPTIVSFTLPTGFEISDLVWPEPVEFTQSGDIKVKGYEGKVLIKANVKAPSDLPAKDSLQFEANVKWVSCSETLCIPKRKKLSLELLAGEKNISADAKLF